MHANSRHWQSSSRHRHLRLAILLAAIGGAMVAATPRARAACLDAPAWVSGPAGTITNAQPTLSWAAVPGATSYTLYILDAAGSNPIIVRQTGITGTSFRSPPLPTGLEMRWKVKGEAPCGPGLYANGQNFTVAAAPSCPPTVPPELFGPSGTIHETAPTFCWTAVPGAEEYVIALLYAADDGDYVFGRAFSTPDTCINLGDLPVNTAMRWKIKTECNEHYGPFSGSVYFTIAP